MNFIYNVVFKFRSFRNVEMVKEGQTCLDLDLQCGKVFSVRETVPENLHGCNKRSKQMSSDLTKRM